MLSVNRVASITDFLRLSVLGINCLLVITTSVSAQAVSESPKRDDRIGVCTHFSQNWSAEEVIPLIAKSGAGWIRDDFGWGGMESTPGNYHIPPKAKAWIQAAGKAGLKIDLILAYGNSAYADHYDTAAYAKAAGWLARELSNEVQAIEILNEPNNFGFRDTYGGQWNGNEPNGAVSPYLQKYVQLLNAAAKEIKLANPHMAVIGLGTPAPASFRMIALGLARQVDGLTDHPYSKQLPEFVAYASTAYFLLRDGIATADANGTFASQVAMFRAQAKKFDATDKLWHTEWGYSTERGKPDKPGMSEETQAVYILRRILESEAIGVEHTGFLAGMPAALPAKQASIKIDPTQGELANRCYTFSSSDGQTTVVAFWEVKPWDPNATTTNAVITLPLARDPHHVFRYDLLSGSQSEISAKLAENVSDEASPKSQDKDGASAKADHRVSIPVSLSGAPQLLIIR
jgi:hypothetical protein